MMTKKKIIEKLKAAETATIAFKGLASVDEVNAKRKQLIDNCKTQVTSYNSLHPDAKLEVVVKDNQVHAGASVLFLPSYPKTGPVVVKSREYVVDGVHCAIKDILVKTYAESALHWGFQTKADSTIIIEN
ncbi:hypothetical protein KAR91_85140 [Candidatus Pacearchaeota archaeon]|nr:hypothetical protein [Candidatus Pacearchaeota archaeon]